MRMRFTQLNRAVPGPYLLILATALLIGLDAGRGALRQAATSRWANASSLVPRREAISQDAAERAAIRDLRRRDVRILKTGLPTLTKSRRAIFEAGLELQEEKRLLEKQWEILTTSVLVDAQEQRIRILRGEEPLEGFRLPVFPPQPYGDELRTVPAVSVVTSKERFAHPDRGVYTEEEGRLIWSPPQVGGANRADALGEFVVFTRGPLILHGPAKKPSDHSAYKHLCLELPLETARRVYAASFVGAKIVLRPAKTPPLSVLPLGPPPLFPAEPVAR